MSGRKLRADWPVKAKAAAMACHVLSRKSTANWEVRVVGGAETVCTNQSNINPYDR